MDHAEAREALELAAVDPGGLDRLMAGDTPAAAAVAGHLAGCDACSVTLVRLRRDAGVVRDLVLTTPPPDLRARTLAFVAELGRPRLPAVEAAGGDAAGVAIVAPEPPGPVPAGRPADRAALRWIAALAAVLVLAVAGTGLLLSTQRDGAIARLDAAVQRQADAIGSLSRITTRSLQVAAQPDAQSVALEGTATDQAGSIVFSPSSGDLVIVAEGLVEPPADREFRCWMEVDGERVPIGRMFFGGALAFWAGPIGDRDALAAAERFGVTLVDAAGTSVDGEPILTGEG
jgi:hypothetical protein